jgi:hypothetical protein
MLCAKSFDIIFHPQQGEKKQKYSGYVLKKSKFSAIIAPRPLGGATTYLCDSFSSETAI